MSSWPRRWKEKAAGSSEESFGSADEKSRCSRCQSLSSHPSMNMARMPMVASSHHEAKGTNGTEM